MRTSAVIWKVYRIRVDLHYCSWVFVSEGPSCRMLWYVLFIKKGGTIRKKRRRNLLNYRIEFRNVYMNNTSAYNYVMNFFSD